MKKPVYLFVAIAFLIFGGACATSALYDNSIQASRAFAEEISSFLITKDGKQLIVIGKKHHYVFATNKMLKFILTSPEKKRVKAAFDDFVINNDQTVSGAYRLTVNTLDLPPETKALLISKGFKSTPQNTLSYQDNIQGQRYLGDKFVLPATLQFNQKYAINMHENYTSGSAITERILLTPLAVAADGLLLIGGIPLLILAIPIAAMQ